ncbi:MAG: hypothetical protein EAZ74_06030 [Alphaproteobacteria bacterium]|nr:MAG: hypothetical protein EAY76_05750 [Alphaproteobacteria bacterium]TAF13311.1 MAG: hypothetical protein EAZ74_06030 [Alphaproteobacteria bacterium]
MAVITTEGTPVGSGSGGGSSISGHLLLILTTDSGQEFVIRGGPTRGADPYGNLILEINKPLESSIDARDEGETAESRGSTIVPLGERNPLNVWD